MLPLQGSPVPSLDLHWKLPGLYHRNTYMPLLIDSWARGSLKGISLTQFRSYATQNAYSNLPEFQVFFSAKTEKFTIFSFFKGRKGQTELLYLQLENHSFVFFCFKNTRSIFLKCSHRNDHKMAVMWGDCRINSCYYGNHFLIHNYQINHCTT